MITIRHKHQENIYDPTCQSCLQANFVLYSIFKITAFLSKQRKSPIRTIYWEAVPFLLHIKIYFPNDFFNTTNHWNNVLIKSNSVHFCGKGSPLFYYVPSCISTCLTEVRQNFTYNLDNKKGVSHPAYAGLGARVRWL